MVVFLVNIKHNLPCGDELKNNEEFEYNFQKAVLVSLCEDKILTYHQYEEALQLLKKKYSKKEK